jgi:hypothetical protein
VAVPAIATYRSAQYLMPIALGGLAYASLRVGPWKIEKRDRLVRLRDLARTEAEKGESRMDFALRFGTRRSIEAPEVDPAIAAELELSAARDDGGGDGAQGRDVLDAELDGADVDDDGTERP